MIFYFQKQLIYEHISDHYRKAGAPVISAQWEEVIQALNNLMSKLLSITAGTNCIIQALDEESCKSLPASPSSKKGMKRCKSSVSKLSKMANGPKNSKKWQIIAKSLKTFRSVAGSSIKDLVRFRTNGKNIFACPNLNQNV